MSDCLTKLNFSSNLKKKELRYNNKYINDLVKVQWGEISDVKDNEFERLDFSYLFKTSKHFFWNTFREGSDFFGPDELVKTVYYERVIFTRAYVYTILLPT